MILMKVEDLNGLQAPQSHQATLWCLMNGQ